MSWVVPTLYKADLPATSTNGFTIGRSYRIRSDNGRVATVLNDNGHERVVPLDKGSNAHLQNAWGCAGYFAVYSYSEECCPDCEGHGANYDRNEVLVRCEDCDGTGTIGATT
jgi:hypothetical protein